MQRLLVAALVVPVCRAPFGLKSTLLMAEEEHAMEGSPGAKPAAASKHTCAPYALHRPVLPYFFTENLKILMITINVSYVLQGTTVYVSCSAAGSVELPGATSSSAPSSASSSGLLPRLGSVPPLRPGPLPS